MITKAGIFSNSLFIIFALISFSQQAKAQQAHPNILLSVEEMPEYPGGGVELMKYITYNFKWPASCKEVRGAGKLNVRFAVMPDGRVDSVFVVRPVNPELDEEGIRVVKSFPKWKPGKQAGVPVAVWYTLPF